MSIFWGGNTIIPLGAVRSWPVTAEEQIPGNKFPFDSIERQIFRKKSDTPHLSGMGRKKSG
jgi:hypothetical protein